MLTRHVPVKQESIKSLNSMLQDRAPKDPSPPRNNKRKSDESSAEVENPKKKKSKIGGNREEKEERELFTGSAAMPATTQASLSQPKPVLNTKDADGNTAVKSVEEAKAKKKRELNVGESPANCMLRITLTGRHHFSHPSISRRMGVPSVCKVN